MNNSILTAAADFGFGDAAVTAVFGYAVVFCGLILLMTVLYIMAAIFKSSAAKKKAAEDAEKAAAAKEQAKAQETEKKPEAPLAPGSAGHVKLYDVPDKEAAMIIAIVAYKMQKPLNELHFISIKEVK